MNQEVDTLISQFDNSEVWNTLTSRTELPREAVKAVIYALLYGGNIIRTCQNYKLGVTEVTTIRCEFDDLMEEAA